MILCSDIWFVTIFGNASKAIIIVMGNNSIQFSLEFIADFLK